MNLLWDELQLRNPSYMEMRVNFLLSPIYDSMGREFVYTNSFYLFFAH